MKIHLVAICGTGMGSLAGLLKEAGHEVRGSDRAFYPPMSERLRAWNIPTLEGFSAEHLDPKTDLVIVGNSCRKDNPEALAALAQGMRVMSFPQALSEYFITSKTSVVVAGTHGKTTTASLLGFLLVSAGMDPSFLVGGIPLNFQKSFHLGKGPAFVVEGDEYDTAFFDKRPKFIHYQPQILVLTSVEYDHADIYPNMDAYRAAFIELLGLIPQDGLLVANIDDPEVASLATKARCLVRTYSIKSQADWVANKINTTGETTRFDLLKEKTLVGRVQLPLAGRHNAANTLAALAAAEALGLDPARAIGFLPGFAGVARRMQVRGSVDGITVLDDFAHHPTKVQETVRAARSRYPDATLVAVFEPRTNSSRRKVFQKQYLDSFPGADEVILVPPFEIEKIPRDDRFDSQTLVDGLTARGQRATLLPDVQSTVSYLVKNARNGSVVLIMSNGAFENIHEKLLIALGQKSGSLP